MDDNILSGSIDNFKFRSEIDGYAVASIDTGKKLVVCTGIFPHCNVGQYIDCVGKYIVDSKYGQQFRAETIRVSSPKDNQSIIKYLSSGFIKGLGPKTAERIVNKFGKDTLDVMEFRPTQLLKISGVTAAKLVEIRESIVKIRQMERAITFLQSKGLGTKACLKIYEAYGDNTVDIVANNPYQLIEDIDGIGFLTADKIAHEIGIPHNSTFRVRAGLLYVLRASTEKEGNTYLPYDICIDQTIQLLQLETSSSLNDVSVVEYDANELVDSVIQELSIDYKIKVVNVDDIKVVMTMQCHQVERRIADMLIQLQSHAIATSLDYVEELEEFEKVNNIRLHQAQKDAIRLSVNSGVCIVTGGPGTGKTTIIRNILSIFQKYKMRVTMLAPTGRAAKRILESTGYEAKTIHRALAWGGGQATRSTSLVADVIIVDE
ncbi:MAG: AAA family ATPase, partial [Firmicutes bacterium]|nr:AAA family ATPase [Bacillota bacterium]